MRLSVKGTKKEVFDALSAHKVPCDGFDVIKVDQFGMILKVSDSFQLQAMYWYNETPGSPPYPPGSLLYFSGPEENKT